MYYLIKRNDCRVPWEEAAKDDTNVILFPKKMMSGNLSDYKLPCWSLAALYSLLPEQTDISKSYSDNCETIIYWCWNSAFDIETKEYDNPVDACVDMILNLHELKML